MMRDTTLRLQLTNAEIRKRRSQARQAANSNNNNMTLPIEGKVCIPPTQAKSGCLSSMSRYMMTLFYGAPPRPSNFTIEDGVTFKEQVVPMAGNESDINKLLEYARSALLMKSMGSSSAKDIINALSTRIGTILIAIQRVVNAPGAEIYFNIAQTATEMILSFISSVMLPQTEAKAAQLHLRAEDGLLEMDVRTESDPNLQNGVSTYVWHEAVSQGTYPPRITIIEKVSPGVFREYEMNLNVYPQDVIEATRRLTKAQLDLRDEVATADKIKIVSTILKAAIVMITKMSQFGIDNPTVKVYLDLAILVLQQIAGFISTDYAINRENTAIRLHNNIVVKGLDELDPNKYVHKTMTM